MSWNSCFEVNDNEHDLVDNANPFLSLEPIDYEEALPFLLLGAALNLNLKHVVDLDYLISKGE